MRLTAVCMTYNRPGPLGEAIWCFTRQHVRPGDEYALVILDDANQYTSRVVSSDAGPWWLLLREPERYPSIGAKQRAVIEAARRVAPCDAVAIWDDDDLYLPHHLAAMAAALERAPWARASIVYDERAPGVAARVKASSARDPQQIDYHGAWGWRLDALDALGGYPAGGLGHDVELARLARQRLGPSADTIGDGYPEPSYVYRRATSAARISTLGRRGWEARGQEPIQPQPGPWLQEPVWPVLGQELLPRAW